LNEDFVKYNQLTIKIFVIVLLFMMSAFTADTNEIHNYSYSDDDIDFRIDFTSGSTIINEPPEVISPVNDLSIIVGTVDTVVAFLPQVYNDVDNNT